MQALKRKFAGMFRKTEHRWMPGPKEHINAQKYALNALRKPEVTHSFNTLQNINHARIRTLYNLWAGPGGPKNLSPAAKNGLWSMINIRSASDFRRHAYRAITWLRRSVNGRPYALLVEVGKTYGELRGKKWSMKSSLWLGGPLMRSFRRAPAMVIPIVYGFVHPDFVKAALRQGIADFVHIDDTVYSGIQKAGIVTNFRGVVQKLRTRVSVRLFIAAAYTSLEGRRAVLEASTASSLKQLKVSFFASDILTRRELNNAVKQELIAKDVRHNSAPLSTIMPHKVPNTVSFGPSSFGMLLETMMPQPPYKRIV